MTSFHKDYLITMQDFVPESNSLLRTRLSDLSIPPTPQDKVDLECMMQYLRNSQDPTLVKKYNLRPGSGLSANQVGLNRRMFAARYQDKNENVREYKLVNPKIISHSTTMTHLPEGEGCLSVDRTVLGHVERYERIKVKAHDENGVEVILSFKGYSSILMQHEIDHMNGILFYDRIDKKNPFIM